MKSVRLCFIAKQRKEKNQQKGRKGSSGKTEVPPESLWSRTQLYVIISFFPLSLPHSWLLSSGTAVQVNMNRETQEEAGDIAETIFVLD